MWKAPSMSGSVSLMGRPRGQFVAQKITGDPSDRFGFPTLVDAFCADLAVRGYAEETIRISRCHLAGFATWLATEGVSHPADVTHAMIEGYQGFLHDLRKPDQTPLTLTSQGARIGPVKRFYEWGTTHGRLPADPTLGLQLPPREQRLPKAVLTFAEAERVLAQPDLTTTLGLRDRAILEVLVSTGMRRSELMRLNTGDIDRGRQAVLIKQAKGRKDRMVPIGARALHWVDRYLDEARPTMDPVDEVIFLSSADGQALGPHRLSGLVAGYVDRAGVFKHGGAHLFRHTLATFMIDAGADIRYVQAMLGHASLNSTQIYTHVSMAALQSVHAETFAGSTFAEAPQ